MMLLARTTPLDEVRRKTERKVRRDGYRGMLAIHPAQVDVIGYKGAMLDRPQLARAQVLLVSGGRG